MLLPKAPAFVDANIAIRHVVMESAMGMPMLALPLPSVRMAGLMYSASGKYERTWPEPPSLRSRAAVPAREGQRERIAAIQRQACYGGLLGHQHWRGCGNVYRFTHGTHLQDARQHCAIAWLGDELAYRSSEAGRGNFKPVFPCGGARKRRMLPSDQPPCCAPRLPAGYARPPSRWE